MMITNNHISDLLMFCYINTTILHLGIESNEKNSRGYNIT